MLAVGIAKVRRFVENTKCLRLICAKCSYVRDMASFVSGKWAFACISFLMPVFALVW